MSNARNLAKLLVDTEGNLLSGSLDNAIGYREIAGLEPEKLSGTVLQLQPGSVVTANGATLYSSSDPISIDLSTNGAGGLDTGSPTNTVNYFVYVLVNNTTKALSAVASSSITYGGVVVPSGHSLVRKLPWGFVYRTAAGWGVEAGIPDFHLSYWPKPYTQFTAFQIASPFIALSSGTATTFTSFSLANWLPDNARLARVMCRTNFGTSTGTAYLRSYGTQSTGIPVGTVTTSGLPIYTTIDIRVDSSRELQYQVNTANINLTVSVMGYSQTEPS
jgi:hypothetical protein